MTDKNFVDWESHVWGFGYGTGEPHTLGALLAFFDAIFEERRYDYTRVEAAIGPMAAWLLINTLCRADILDYGCSARYGWLSPKGEILRDYLRGQTLDDLTAILNAVDQDYAHCFPDYCNCDGEKCQNPLFTLRRPA